MNKNNIIKIVNKELAILKDIIEDFDEAEDIQAFEVDLALSKATDIYNILSLLKGTEPINKTTPPTTKKTDNIADNLNISLQEQIIEPQTKEIGNAPIEEIHKSAVENIDEAKEAESLVEDVIEAEIPEENKESEQVEIADDIDKPVVNGSEEVEEEIPVSDEDMTVKQEKVIEEEPKVKLETKVANNTKGEILADQFQSQKVSINDTLSNFQKDKNLATLLTDRPIKDLQKAVKLNDRIWYIQELFSNKTELYNKTIAELNALDNLNDALSYLFEKFSWDQSKKSTISFLELIYRRFSN